MTNGWTDMRNADVILAMGGNPGGESSSRLPVRHGSQAQPQRQAGGGRSALQAHAPPSPTCSSRSAPAPTSPSSAGSSTTRSAHNRYHDEYVRLYTNATVPGERGVRVRREDAACSAGGTGRQVVHRQVELGYDSMPRTTFANVDPRCRHPRCGLPAHEGVLRALHAADGVVHLRLHARTTSRKPPSSSRRRTRQTSRHHHVRARLDAPQPSRSSSFTQPRCCSFCSATSACPAAD